MVGKKMKKLCNKFSLIFFTIFFTYALAVEPEPIIIGKTGVPILDGQALTVFDLFNLKNKPEALLASWETELTQLEQSNDNKNDKKITLLKTRIQRLQLLMTYIAPYIFWWQSIPTIGLRLEEPFWPIHYPYLPHAFLLWELAPHMGKDIDVFLIDTGIAAFNLSSQDYYKKHQDLQMLVDFSKDKYNFVAHIKDMLDPFEQLVELLVEYTDDAYDNEHYIRTVLPSWIRTYINDQKSTTISNYLCKYGKDFLWQKTKSKKTLTEEGKRALREILHGEQGFKPKHANKKHAYTVVDLNTPNDQKNIVLEFVPTAPIFQDNLLCIKNDKKEESYFSAAYESGHGSHSSGIIGGLLHSYTGKDLLTPSKITKLLHEDSGMCGIAPQTHTVMIKALRSDGEISDRTTVSKAVKHAHRLGAKILNLSLKVDDQLDVTAPDVIQLQSSLAQIPYVVASSGNATKKVLGSYQAGIEGYPAKFPSIPFDVGAFSFYKDSQGLYHCPIPEFSQYQENIGPKFVMPGHNILSCGLVPNQKEDSMYVFMQGTSAAAPMISGFLALLLGEFSGEFGKNERTLFLKVCYISGIRLENSKEWKNKTLLGTLDCRTVLFTLHVLKKLKENSKESSILKKKYPFNKYSDHYIKAIHTILDGMVNDFREKNKIDSSFKNNFIGFFNETLPKRSETLMKGKIFHSLEDAILYVADSIIATLDPGFRKFPKGYNALQHKNEIEKIFACETLDLFSKYTHGTKTRLALAL